MAPNGSVGREEENREPQDFCELTWPAARVTSPPRRPHRGSMHPEKTRRASCKLTQEDQVQLSTEQALTAGSTVPVTTAGGSGMELLLATESILLALPTKLVGY
jgi:hypothetical protein